MAGRELRMAEAPPVHARGIAKHFVKQLDDRDLAVLESALAKVTLDCGFGWRPALGDQAVRRIDQR